MERFIDLSECNELEPSLEDEGSMSMEKFREIIYSFKSCIWKEAHNGETALDVIDNVLKRYGLDELKVKVFCPDCGLIANITDGNGKWWCKAHFPYVPKAELKQVRELLVGVSKSAEAYFSKEKNWAIVDDYDLMMMPKWKKFYDYLGDDYNAPVLHSPSSTDTF